MDWFGETLHADWAQRIKVERVIYRAQSEHQDIIVFESAKWGKVLALDGVIQTTTADEFAYHEMLIHPAIIAHGHVRSVLIIGGGDGGSLREVLRHEAIERIVQIEIDQGVIDLCREYLPELSQDAFDNPRAQVKIGDGARYVAETDEKFDLIVIDSTDPIGPGEVLFTAEFYRNCRKCLNEGGVLVTQSGNPAVAGGELATGQSRLVEAGFGDVSYILTSVPTYIGGFMALGWASDNAELRKLNRNIFNQREIPKSLRYYNPAIHEAAFAHPNWIDEIISAKLI